MKKVRKTAGFPAIPRPIPAAVLLAAVLIATASADTIEPRPVIMSRTCGPVIRRAEAGALGLFRYRRNFAALRFTRTGPDSFQARAAYRVSRAMVEQAVELDSAALERVRAHLFVNPQPTAAELMLTPVAAVALPELGPPSTSRATAGAACFGALGLGAGLVTGTILTYNPDSLYRGFTPWHRRNLGITAGITVATTALASWAGWHIGNALGGGRPARPAPRCAIAAYDAAGYPIYEEELRRTTGRTFSCVSACCGLGLGSILTAVVTPLVASIVDYGRNPNGIGGVAPYTLIPGLMAATLFVAGSIGAELDRDAEIGRLYYRWSYRPPPLEPWR